MSELIRQIAKQAGMIKILREHAHEYGNGMFEDTPYPELEKFAELIINECVRVPYDMWDKAELNADIAVKIENRIRNHFGDEG